MTVNITIDDIKSFAYSKGLVISDAQAQEVLNRYTEREWLKAKWHIEDIMVETDIIPRAENEL